MPEQAQSILRLNPRPLSHQIAPMLQALLRTLVVSAGVGVSVSVGLYYLRYVAVFIDRQLGPGLVVGHLLENLLVDLLGCFRIVRKAGTLHTATSPFDDLIRLAHPMVNLGARTAIPACRLRRLTNNFFDSLGVEADNHTR